MPTKTIEQSKVYTVLKLEKKYTPALDNHGQSVSVRHK
jgi:hypothetical protein